MPRIGRVVIPDVPYHITQRGNYRQEVFSDAADYEIYIDFFERNRKKFGLKGEGFMAIGPFMNI